MADNVTITSGANSTPPAGTVVSTDEAASGHVQRVKLTLSADGSDTHLQADADGLLVNLGTNNDVTVTSGTITLAPSTVNIGDVDVLTVPAPLSTTGGGTEATALRVTLANDSTGLVSVDDNGGSLTVDAPVGTPVNVQIGDGTRTATVRDTGSSDSLNVSVVDASGNQVTSFGGGTEYTEDAAAAADPVGRAAILVRKDTPATVTGTDGDNVAQRGTNYGAAYVQLVTSGGAYIDSVGGGGVQYTEGDVDATITGTTVMWEDTGNTIAAVSLLKPLPVSVIDYGYDEGTGASPYYIEDAAATSGGVGILALGVRRDADTSPVSADNDNHTFIFDGSGNLKVNVKAGTLSVSGAIDTELATAQSTSVDALAISASPGVLAASYLYDGSSAWDRGRRIVDGLNSTGTGIFATGIIGQLDDTATASVTENQFAPVRISSARRLLVDGSGVIQPVSGTVSVSGTQATLLAATSQTTGTEADIDITVTGYATVIVRITGNSSLVTTTAYSFHGNPVATAGNNRQMQGRDLRTGEIVTNYSGLKSVDRLYAYNVAGLTVFQIRAGVISAGTVTFEVTGSTLLNQAVVSAAVGPAEPRISRFTHASVSAASSGENTLVSATAGQTIRVMEVNLVFAGAVDVKFKDAAAGTDLTGAIPMQAGGSIVKDNVGDPHFTTALGGAFIMNLSAAVQVSGWIKYTKGVSA